MFYKVTFWIYFVSASLLCTLWMLATEGRSFPEIVILAFGAGFVVAYIVNLIVKMIVQAFKRLFNFGGYRRSISGKDY